MGNKRVTQPATVRARVWGPALAVMAAAVMSACGGGGDDGTSTPASTVQGTAAAGAFMRGAQVTMVDGAGKLVGTQTADANGHYAFDVTQFQAPFAIVASGGSATYVSVLAQKPAAGLSATANVTPLTTAVVALLVASSANASLDLSNIAANIATIQSIINAAKIQQAVAVVQAVLANVSAAVGVIGFDPISTPLTAQGQGADKIIDSLIVSLVTGGVKLTQVGVDLSANASPPSVTLTAGSLASPPAALPRPTSSVDASAFETIRQNLQACFALPTSGRALNAQPVNACAQAFSSDYLNNSFTAVTDSTISLLSDDNTGATFLPPVLVYTNTNAQSQQIAEVHFPFVRPDGSTGMFAKIVTNRAGTWTLAGNQRDFEAAITRRVSKVTELNPVAGSLVSRYETALRLLLNPNTGSLLTAQVARVTGPGLPVAGVVLTRSTACGTAGEMAIQNTSGSLTYAADDPVAPNQVIYATNQSASTLALAATPVSSADTLTWSALNGGSVRYAPTPLSNADIEALPTFGKYTFEVWNLNTDGTAKVELAETPDKTFTLLDGGPVRTPVSLGLESWNSVDASTLGYLSPGSGAVPSVNVQWTQTSDVVDRAAVFALRNQLPLPLRFAAQVQPVSHASRSVTVFASKNSSNGNAACSQASYPVMATGDQRTVELRSTTADETQKFTRVIGRL